MDLIVNVTEDWGIGLNGSLLVSISQDLKRFRQLTTGRTVILGRKTLATFPGGRPLKNRENWILSATAQEIPGARVFPSLDALRLALREADLDAVSVIGGASVYRALLPYCSTAHITRTLLRLPADTFFPDLDALPNWSLESAQPLLEEDGVSFRYETYQNHAPLPIF